ncbi:hypothetical protein [Hylemonella gracilis]|uniref:hypothetical protein n=1 Tax=Hylemonella gracilis TaxID=80880 RepID=UPI00103B30BE|nr:hypothetical protein [Hylemonella gracilis]
MIFKKITTADGWFAKPWGTVFSFGGIAIAVLPWFLGVNVWYCLLLTFLGSTVSLIGSYEAKARQFGYQAPFTNDPLGWRRAKRSYEKKDADANADELDKSERSL